MPQTYSVEYAVSGRAKCKVCKDTIDLGALRFGCHSDDGDRNFTAWRHAHCQKQPRSKPTKDEVTGFNSLSKTDQKIILDVLAGKKVAQAGKGKKAKAANEEEDEDEDGEGEDDEEEAPKPKKKPAKGTKRKREEHDDAGEDGGAGGGSALAGQVFCITGKFSQPRTAIEKLIHLKGGETAGTVSKRVTTLLCEGDEGSSKYNKAEELGIAIQDEAWLMAAISGGGSKPPAKKAKTEPAPKAAKSAPKAAAAAVKSAPAAKAKVKKGTIPVDDAKAKAGAVVLDNFDCTLNQTNIARNNNKFYRIQLIDEGGRIRLWTRWGRIGAAGQTQSQGNWTHAQRKAAEDAFERKFRAKTLNAWGGHFVPRPGKYTLIDVDHGDDDEEGGGEGAEDMDAEAEAEAEDEEEEEEEEEEGGKAKGKAKAKAVKAKAAKAAGGKSAATVAEGSSALFDAKLKTGQQIIILQCDIVDIEADAIIHPTNASMGFGGQVGQVLIKAAGPTLQKEADDFRAAGKSIKEIECALSGAGELPATHIIHVNSPHYTAANKKQACEALEDTITNALQMADDNNLKSVAFPAIGSGVNKYPKDVAAKTILTAIGNYFTEVEKQGATSGVESVYFVLYDQEAMDMYTSSYQEITGGLDTEAPKAPAAAAKPKAGPTAAAKTSVSGRSDADAMVEIKKIFKGLISHAGEAGPGDAPDFFCDPIDASKDPAEMAKELFDPPTRRLVDPKAYRGYWDDDERDENGCLPVHDADSEPDVHVDPCNEDKYEILTREHLDKGFEAGVWVLGRDLADESEEGEEDANEAEAQRRVTLALKVMIEQAVNGTLSYFVFEEELQMYTYGVAAITREGHALGFKSDGVAWS